MGKRQLAAWCACNIVVYAGIGVLVGLLTNLFPAKSLSTALALPNATPWIGIVIGLSAEGAAIRAVSMTRALLLAVVLSLVALFLLLPIAKAEPARWVDARSRRGTIPVARQ
jgi:predicted MFS family arabinose efflux permease